MATLNKNTQENVKKSASDFFFPAAAPVVPRWSERIVYAVAEGVGNVSFW